MKKICAVIVWVVLTFCCGHLAWSQEPAPPSFVLQTIDGRPFALKDSLGQKTIVLNFWAAWCTTCAEEMPQLLSLQKKYAGQSDVLFVGVNAGDTERAAQKFVDRQGYSYLILMDKDKSVAKEFLVTCLPQTLVISKGGQIVYRASRPPESL